jgi:hypothetical protein
MICTDFSPFFICVNHKNLRQLRAIFTQNYAERSIKTQKSRLAAEAKAEFAKLYP